MINRWQFVKTPPLPGKINMNIDLMAFQDFEKGNIPPTLRIYSWKPKCISVGYSQEIEVLIDIDKAKELGWDVVKRPTGGGIVFHNETEVAYSLVTRIDDPFLPRGLIPSYLRISEAVAFGLRLIGISAEILNPGLEIRKNLKNSRVQIQNHLCFAWTNGYEVVAEGKKIAGSAQKRSRYALLQQGSIFVQKVPDQVYSVLKQPETINNAVSIEELLGRVPSFEELAESLKKGFEEKIGVKFD